MDNTGTENSKLYTQPQEVFETYSALSKVGSRFTIAAAFGNVHGVYSPGNVELRPDILKNSQTYVAEQLGLNEDAKPVSFVFHGGSGSPKNQINETLDYGVIKMNIDTDMQWAFWEGILHYYEKNRDYMQTQLGNPGGHDKPNKKYYDPRVWLRKGQDNFVKRLEEGFTDLNCIGRNK